MAEAFFEDDDAPCAAIVVVEGVDVFKLDVEVQDAVQVGGGMFVGMEQVG